MDDFFKSMKDQLENRPEPEFRESAWKALNSRLDASNPVASRPRRYWWTAALLLLLLGSTFCNYWFYRQLNSNETAAAKEIRIYHKDTIHHTRYVYHTDTVFQSRIVEVPVETVAAGLDYSGQYYLSRPSFARLDERFAFSESPLNLSLFSSLPRLPLFSSGPDRRDGTNKYSEEDHSSVLNRFTLFYGLPQAIDELESPERKAPDTDMGLIAKVEKKKSFGKRLIYGLKPKRVYVGPTLGGIYPVHSDLRDQKGFSVGLQAAISFSNQFRVWGEATYLRVAYTTTQLESLRGVPAITPPSSNFDFINAGVPQPALQYSLGIHYTLVNGGKWRPYAALGFSTLTLLPFEVTYKFEDVLNNLELTLEQKVDRKRQFSQHTLAKLGLETYLNKHWSLQLESIYRMSLETQGATNTNLFGLRVGALYRF